MPMFTQLCGGLSERLPNSVIARACRAALSLEKQQKMTRFTVGAADSASTVVETAMPAARSAGKR